MLKRLIFTLLLMLTGLYATPTPYPDLLLLNDKNNVPEYVKEVITINLRSQVPPDLRTRRAFWFALNDYKPFTEERIKVLELVLVGKAVDLLTLFYEDTLIAIEQDTQYKSTERTDLEATLLSLQSLTDLQIKGYDELQESILNQARNEKLPNETKTLVTGFIDILKQSKTNLNLLFIPIPLTGG